MGIPCYFSHIVKSYKGVIKVFEDALVCDNLYFDGNSIIYDELRVMDNKDTIENTINKLIYNVCKKLEIYINEIKPKRKVFICFDGVAPIAKLEQQRGRRYKSTIEREFYKEYWGNIEKTRALMPEEISHPTRKQLYGKIDTNIITPGTRFYEQLNLYCKNYFDENKKNEYCIDELVFSGSNCAGEGEHKIFEKIRNEKSYHQHTKTFVYGIDSDLIMLGLNHTLMSDFNIYLYRETPHFIQSIDKNLEPNRTYVVDIPKLALSIMNYLSGDETICKSKVHDYIFLCFMLGNDFVPKIPSINIRRNGVDYILKAYKQITNKSNQNIINGLSINWKMLGKIVQFMSNIEELVLQKECNYRNKIALEHKVESEKWFEYDIARYFNSTPFMVRNSETNINPYKKGWQDRYYEVLFKTKDVEKICHNYLESMEWCYYYYSNGCCDKTWYYGYNYGPLLTDLVLHLPTYQSKLQPTICTKQNISELCLLCYVTPQVNLRELVPLPIASLLLEAHPEWYQSEWNMEYSFCTYTWESHTIACKIDIQELQRLVESCKSAKKLPKKMN